MAFDFVSKAAQCQKRSYPKEIKFPTWVLRGVGYV